MCFKPTHIPLYLLLIVVFLQFGVSGGYAQETDTFQQVTNYIMFGDPYVSENEFYGAEAQIFDRQNCVAGMQFDDEGFVKIYWNNIDRKSIRISSTYNEGMEDRFYLLNFSGSKPVIEYKIVNQFVALEIWLTWGITNGSYNSIALPVGPTSVMDKTRIKNALNLLYTEHCTGSKIQAAF